MVVWRRVLVSSVVTGLLLMAFAAEALASDPEPGSDVATRLQECEGIFVWGQVWLDTDGDARLTEDAGVDAVVVRVEQSGGTTPTVTDDDGFWGVCLLEEQVNQETSVAIDPPAGGTAVTEGVGDEDNDSDIDVATLETVPFIPRDQLRTATPEFETTERTIRVDAGLTIAEVEPSPEPSPTETAQPTPSPAQQPSAAPEGEQSGAPSAVNPCPAYTTRAVEEDAEGDWDDDGILNADDPAPCAEGDVPVATPCPDWSAESIEQDPDGDWDADDVSNRDDPAPCEATVAQAADEATDEASEPAINEQPSDETNEAVPGDDETTTPDDDGDDGVPLLPILIGVAVSGAGIAAALVLRGRGAVPANGGASSGPPGLTDPDGSDDSDDSDDDKRGTIVGGKD